ncbi:unnamed protein product [Linum trigynum]|uniref:Rab escort protein 1 n=1 Tax=Linum trigynum TaxID=586398 RepID=A0AAV2EL74_9ROSI
MSEPPQYPPVDPTTFDLVVIGTGLPESVIAAAASTSGKSVLHLDPNPFYGSHFASLSIPELTSFLNSSSAPPVSLSSSQAADGATEDPKFSIINLSCRSLYSDVEISSLSPTLLEECSRKFLLDVSGPRVLFCADKAIDLMMKSEASQYVEFKGIDASFIGDGNGALSAVPDSRAAIFKDKSLNLIQKNQLMRFFKLVQGHLRATAAAASTIDENQNEEGEVQEAASMISEEDLESPFVDFLTKMQLPPKIKSIILYAIAMADHDQENREISKHLLKTKDGVDRLARYQSSIGRFANAYGPFIYPIYGQGELPQAFCRRAAVKGCIYVLRMGVVGLLVEKSSGSYKGVKLASGQELFSNKLLLNPAFTISSPSTSPADPLCVKSPHLTVQTVKSKVVRGICITKRSLKPDISNLLVLYPPQSLYPEQFTPIRVLQIGGNSAICPVGMFVLYLLALCEDGAEGKKLLNGAMSALLAFPDCSKSDSVVHDENVSQTVGSEEGKPALLWSALYVQEMQTMGRSDFITSTPTPDGDLDYSSLFDATLELFQTMYPNTDVFPETSSSEEHGGENLES